MASAQPTTIVNPVLRKLFAVLFVGLLVLPAAAELCAAVGGLGCATSQHACCEGPRLTNCDCDAAHAAEQSGPAQRINNVRTDTVTVPLLSERPQITSPAVVPDCCQRAVGTSDRLSLLSTLLI